MSQVKPFLLALSLLPISLSAFQIAALAQTTQIFGSPSKGLSGSASGNNALNIIYKNNYLEKTVVLTEEQQRALNASAQSVFGVLKSSNDAGKLVTILGLKTNPLNLDAALTAFDSAKTAYTALISRNRAPTTIDEFEKYSPDFKNTSQTFGDKSSSISYSLEKDAADAAQFARDQTFEALFDFGASLIMAIDTNSELASKASKYPLASAGVREAAKLAADKLASREITDVKNRGDKPALEPKIASAIGDAINAMLDVYSETITIKSGTKTLNLDTSKYVDKNAAVSVAAAILDAGGTIEQAELGASLAGTGADPKSCISLVAALSGFLAGVNTASLPTTIPSALLNDKSWLTATGIKTKSLDFGKNLIAQTRAAVQVDANKLNRLLLAYNDLIDKSTPEAVANLAKNEDFKLIGNNLRQLRASIR